MAYRTPFDTSAAEYATEPTDQQANTLLRALAHYVAAYAEPPLELRATAIANDLLSSNAMSADPISRDEAERLAAVLGAEV